MSHNGRKRFAAAIMTCCMCMSLVPSIALAEGVDQDTTQSQTPISSIASVKRIDTVALSATTPATGSYPAQITTTTKGVSLSNIHWYDYEATKKESGVTYEDYLTDYDKFQNGKTYCAEVTISAKNGFFLNTPLSSNIIVASEEDFTSNFISCSNADFVKIQKINQKMAIVTLGFNFNKINTIDISLGDLLKDTGTEINGSIPASVSSEELPYALTDESYNVFIWNGYGWDQCNDGQSYDPSKEYAVFVDVETKDKNSFADSVRANVHATDVGNVYITDKTKDSFSMMYTFGKYSPAIDSIYCANLGDMTSLVAGDKLPDISNISSNDFVSTANIPTNSEAKIVTVSANWQELIASSNVWHDVNADSVAKSNAQYRLKVNLKAVAPYKWTDSVSSLEISHRLTEFSEMFDAEATEIHGDTASLYFNAGVPADSTVVSSLDLKVRKPTEGAVIADSNAVSMNPNVLASTVWRKVDFVGDLTPTYSETVNNEEGFYEDSDGATFSPGVYLGCIFLSPADNGSVLSPSLNAEFIGSVPETIFVGSPFTGYEHNYDNESHTIYVWYKVGNVDTNLQTSVNLTTDDALQSDSSDYTVVGGKFGEENESYMDKVTAGIEHFDYKDGKSKQLVARVLHPDNKAFNVEDMSFIINGSKVPDRYVSTTQTFSEASVPLYPISIASQNGSITADKNIVFPGDKVKLTCSADYGYGIYPRVSAYFYVDKKDGTGNVQKVEFDIKNETFTVPEDVSGPITIVGEFLKPGTPIDEGNVLSPTTYTVTFETDGGSKLRTVTCNRGDTVSLKEYAPTREGYTFNGWYADKDLRYAVTSIKVYENTTVYAEWIENTDSGTINPWFFRFDDVSNRDWFYDAVYYNYNNGYFKGISNNLFDPNGTMTRAMFATVLYRMDGSKMVSGANPFTDTETNTWYSKAILWASQNNIIEGYGDYRFGPNDPITREQMATIMYRYASYKGYNVNSSTSLNQFNDRDDISSYAYNALSWSVARDLIEGTGNKNIAPKHNATRAQVAAILMRFDKNILGK